MSFKDMLLHLDSYPDATPAPVIDEAVRLAAKLGGRLSALSVAIQIPLHSNRVADYLLALTEMTQAEERKSREAARAALERFAEQASAAGVAGEALLERCDLFDLADRVATRARSRDVCIIPLGGRFDDQRDVALAAIFGSGRPVIIFKPGATPPGPLRRVVVAWDGGRAAARALSDALPVLTEAPEVRLVTVVDDKPSAAADLGEAARRRLEAYGIRTAAENLEADGESAGSVLAAYAEGCQADLLVMGAYGHSRLREFLLGGATEHLLWQASTPVLFSH